MTNHASPEIEQFLRDAFTGTPDLIRSPDRVDIQLVDTRSPVRGFAFRESAGTLYLVNRAAAERSGGYQRIVDELERQLKASTEGPAAC